MNFQEIQGSKLDGIKHCINWTNIDQNKDFSLNKRLRPGLPAMNNQMPEYWQNENCQQNYSSDTQHTTSRMSVNSEN